MVAVGGKHLVARFAGVQGAERNGFLPDIKVQVAADFAGTKGAVALLFEVANIKHLLIGVQQVVVRQMQRFNDGVCIRRLQTDGMGIVPGGGHGPVSAAVLSIRWSGIRLGSLCCRGGHRRRGGACGHRG